MLFHRIEPRDTTGALLSTTPEGVYICIFQNNISDLLTLVPVINDEGIPQDVRLVTVVPDQQFYEFVAADPYKRTDDFNTGTAFTFDFRIKRKPQGGLMIPCNITSTLFFTAMVNGKMKKKQRTQSMLIQ